MLESNVIFPAPAPVLSTTLPVSATALAKAMWSPVVVMFAAVFTPVKSFSRKLPSSVKAPVPMVSVPVVSPARETLPSDPVVTVAAFWKRTVLTLFRLNTSPAAPLSRLIACLNVVVAEPACCTNRPAVRVASTVTFAALTISIVPSRPMPLLP